MAFKTQKKDKTVAMPKSMANDSEGVYNLKRVLEENMLPNPFIKMLQGYQKRKKNEKREDNPWDQNIKKYSEEMEELEMVIPNVLYRVALLKCSNFGKLQQ